MTDEKKYERLTERVGNEVHELAWSGELLHRLAELEDKIENGTLVELPCKVGDTVYSIPFDYDKEIFKHKVKALRLLFISEADDCDFIENNFAWWGENIFSTKAEAEKKLKELKGEV